jgi:NitT/TauT family transport system permease protein/sulfonate transport system permease protein
MAIIDTKRHTVEEPIIRRGPNRLRLVVTFLFAIRHLIPIGLLVVLWEVGARLGISNPNLFSSPSAIGQAMLDLSSTGMLWRDACASVTRVSIGFSIAAIVGISLGLLLGRASQFARYVLPLIEVIRPVSVIAWIPIAILWFGLGDRPSWFLIALGSFFPIFTNSYDGARALADVYVRVSQCFGAPRWLYLRRVLVPATLPHIMTGLRVGLGTGWTCVIAAELISATSGLGYMIQLARTTIETEKVFAGMVVIGVIGFLMNALMLTVERRVLPPAVPTTR